MRCVVIESPYAGEVDRNIHYARRAIHDCLTRGEAPIASHLLFTQPGVLDDNDSRERSLGIAAGLAWMPCADAIVVYTDYGVSPGMQAAIERAKFLQIPVEYRSLKKQ